MIRVRIRGTGEVYYLPAADWPLVGIARGDSEERRDKITAEKLVGCESAFSSDSVFPGGLVADDKEAVQRWDAFIRGENAFFQFAQKYYKRYGEEVVNDTVTKTLENSDVNDPCTYWLDASSALVRAFGPLDL